MRFPFRLTTSLLKNKIANLSGISSPPPILRLSPDENCIESATSSASPVLWLSDAKAAPNPAIGAIAKNLSDFGRHVFVHTDGHSLRQRIHEFRPDERLFLTLEFAGREEAHNKAAGRPDAFRSLIEAIRTAKLSGFLVAAHVTVIQETDRCDLGELIEFLD